MDMPSQFRRARHSRASKRAGSERGLVEGSSGRGRPLDSAWRSVRHARSSRPRTQGMAGQVVRWTPHSAWEAWHHRREGQADQPPVPFHMVTLYLLGVFTRCEVEGWMLLSSRTTPRDWFKCTRPEHPAHGGVMLCTVQCRPASACARKSPPRGCTLKKQDKDKT